MAWSELTRRQHARTGDRYASDLTDAEWAIIEPLMPSHKSTGRPRETDLRSVFDAILYISTTGCRVADVGERLSSGFDGAGVLLRLAQ